jgi:hypothetical protein
MLPLDKETVLLNSNYTEAAKEMSRTWRLWFMRCMEDSLWHPQTEKQAPTNTALKKQLHKLIGYNRGSRNNVVSASHNTILSFLDLFCMRIEAAQSWDTVFGSA